MKRSFFCIHDSRLLLLIMLLLVKQRKQVIAVKYLFCKILKRRYSQMKILKLLSFAKIRCAADEFFSKLCDQNWTSYRRNRHQLGPKSHSKLIFCNFLNRLTTQFTTISIWNLHLLWKFQTNRTNILFVVWVRVDGVYIYIS